MRVLALAVCAFAAPALAQGGALPKDAPVLPVPSADADSPSEAPPPPSVPIPGIDAPDVALPAEVPVVEAEAPPPPEAGPEYVPVPGAPSLLSPRIHRSKGYFGMGLGFGLSNYANKSFAGNGAGLAALRFGRIASDQVLFGAELQVFGQYDAWKVNTQVGSGISSVMGEVMVFPWANIPLNVAAGVGWGLGVRVSRLNSTTDGTPVVASGNDGVSWMAALGWDFFAGPGWNLGVQARYDGVHFADLGNVKGGALQIWVNSY